MNEKHSKPSRRTYDATFKKEVLQMAESGRPITDIAKSLGVGENLIYRWRSRQNKNRLIPLSPLFLEKPISLRPSPPIRCTSLN